MKTRSEGTLHIYIVSMTAITPRRRLTLRRLVVRVTEAKCVAAARNLECGGKEPKSFHVYIISRSGYWKKDCHCGSPRFLIFSICTESSRRKFIAYASFCKKTTIGPFSFHNSSKMEA
jgi:hypothetical protein